MAYEEFTTWRRVLRDFREECALADAASQADRIRQALDLLNFVKDVTPTRAAQVHRLLAAEAYESAAIALLEPETWFFLSRGPNGTSLASVMLEGQTEESTAEGATLALALLMAKASALIKL
jgi:hypothetical protein